MRKNLAIYTTALTLLAALAMSPSVAAQDNETQHNKTKPQQYKVIDLGTLGGPNSYLEQIPAEIIVNNGGTVAASADTSIPDPYFPNCFNFDCFVSHAVQWQNGVLIDLGALPGVNSSFASSINARGLIVGVSENGLSDPQTGAPELEPTLFRDGTIINLGTLGGNQSVTNGINNRGQVVGGALNTIPDPFSNTFSLDDQFLFVPATTQAHAFLWQEGKGVMRDLGTLGGPDSCASFVNERGQIAGESYTNSTPNSTTGQPTLDPFLWENGTMTDLGTLGGTYGYPNWLNNRGQVVGESALLGDTTSHPFLWERGVIKDLGTFGGPFGAANWINEAGQVVGYADIPGDSCLGFLCVHHAFLWEGGVKTDLGTFGTDPCSNANSINQKGQVVGYSTPVCGSDIYNPVLWENGAMYNLNALIPPGSDITVAELVSINDRGEIAGYGGLPNGHLHAVLLVPDGDCDYECEGRIAASQNKPAAIHGSAMPNNRMPAMGEGSARRHHLPGLGPNK